MFLLTNDKSYVIMTSKTILGGIHMYTSEKSTKLTLFISYCFCFLLVVIMIGIIPGINWILGGAQFAKVCIAAFYICCPAAWTTLYCIIKLLKNILNNDIFSQKSVKLLRILSWCCAYVCAVCFCVMFIFRLFFVFFLGAGLMTLILRVLKNVFAKATEIKEENELTI